MSVGETSQYRNLVSRYLAPIYTSKFWELFAKNHSNTWFVTAKFTKTFAFTSALQIELDQKLFFIQRRNLGSHQVHQLPNKSESTLKQKQIPTQYCNIQVLVQTYLAKFCDFHQRFFFSLTCMFSSESDSITSMYVGT